MAAFRCQFCGAQIHVDVRSGSGVVPCPSCHASVPVPAALLGGEPPAGSANANHEVGSVDAWQPPPRSPARPGTGARPPAGGPAQSPPAHAASPDTAAAKTPGASATPPGHAPAAVPGKSGSGPVSSAPPLRKVPMGRPGTMARSGTGGKDESEARVIRRPPPRRKDGFPPGGAQPQGPGMAPGPAGAPAAGYPGGTMASPTPNYPAAPAYPPATGYPSAAGYPPPAAPAMPAPGGGQVSFRLLEHVPGGPADAEQARRFFLESQFDQVWAVYSTAIQQGVPKPMVFLLDHSDERGRRLANLARPGYGQPGFGPTLARPYQGPLGATYAEAAAFPVWKACEVLAAEGLHYLYEPTARETSPDQFMVLVVSLYSVSGFRMGVGPAGY